MREKRSLSWWIIFLESSPKGENVHIWRQNAFWGPQPPPEVPCNRKSKHFPLKTLFDGFPFSFAFRLERRHFSTPGTGLRAGRRRKRKPPGALPAGEPREGPARSQLPETQQLWSCAKVWPGQGAAKRNGRGGRGSSAAHSCWLRSASTIRMATTSTMP